MIIKRSECGCICHTDAVALGMIAGPMHVTPCCEPDIGTGGYCPRCDTVWASPGKCKCEPMEKIDWICDKDVASKIWNAAIEAAAETITRLNREGPYQAITGATEIRKLKK